MLSTVSISLRVGCHKLFELLHIGDALDILFLLEPLLDGRSIEIQLVALTDKRNVVTSYRSVHCGFLFTKHLANILNAH